jgi:nucleotide-binding universal stress UspA family protein
MKPYQRILVPLTHGHSGAALLRQTSEIALPGRSAVLVVSVVDTRSGFDLDGPAGNLPGERAARLVPAEQRRLEHELLRHDLRTAQVSVIVGEPRTALSEIIQSWRPDTIVCDARTRSLLPASTLWEGPDLLDIGRHGAFARLAGFFTPGVQGGHA